MSTPPPDPSPYAKFQSKCSIIYSEILTAEKPPSLLMQDVHNFYHNIPQTYPNEQLKFLYQIIQAVKSRANHKFVLLEIEDYTFYSEVLKVISELCISSEFHNENVNCLNALSVICYKQGELQDALKANQLARKYAYKNEGLIYLGVCYMVKSMLEIMRENWAGVVKHAERAIKLFGQNEFEEDQEEYFEVLGGIDAAHENCSSIYRNLAEAHFNLAYGYKGKGWNTKAQDAFVISGKLYRKFDEKDDWKMLARTEDEIRNLTIVIDSYQKDIEYIKESSNFKFMTGKRKVRPIKMPTSSGKKTNHKLQEELSSMRLNSSPNKEWTDPYMESQPRYVDMTGTGKKKRDHNEMALIKNCQEDFLHQVDEEFDPENYPIHNKPLGESTQMPGPGYIQEMRSKMDRDIKARNAIKQDETRRSVNLKNVKSSSTFDESKLDCLPSRLANIGCLMDDASQNKMEYFLDLRHKFVPRVEPPWANPLLNYGQSQFPGKIA